MTKRKKASVYGGVKDPHAAREAEKYDKPVPSREFILDFLKKHKAAATLQELYDAFSVHDEYRQEALRRRVKAMLRDAQLEQLSKRRFIPVRPRVLVEGRITVDKKRAFWVIPESGGARILLPRFVEDKVYQGNRVVVSIPKQIASKSVAGKRKDPIMGKLVEVLEQENMIVTGQFMKVSGVSYVTPSHHDFPYDILIPPNQTLGAKENQVVVVEVLPQQVRRSELTGKIIEILGTEKTKGIEVAAAIRKHQLPYLWEAPVQKLMQKFKNRVSESDKKDRVDLTELPLVTIDGEDSRDFDDAVFCEPKSNGGWRLYVAIADVSAYVKPKSVLDKVAQERGNSVYFPTEVIPMLPKELSNGLCSLNPNEERLCMVCEMSISQAGKVTRYEFYEGVMKSHMRFTYTKVAKILEEDPVLCKEYSEFVEDLENLHEMYSVLKTERERRGAIDFDTVETQISIGKNGKISNIEPIERNVAHRIIEECMLCANVATAKFLSKYKIPSLYRNHQGPHEEKLTDLKKFLSELGLSFGKSKTPKSLDYGTLLRRIKHRPDAQVIQTILLRSLCQAVYSPDNIGHFGLAYPAYTHFTSPIRRYPDLLVHRQIKAVLDGKWDPDSLDTPKGEAKAQKLERELEKHAHHCSMTERRADDASRDVINALKCQYMQQHIGEYFEGIISSVTRFGFFVELKDYYVEGLVHITTLGDDYYVFDNIHHCLTGERYGTVYQLGTPVTIQVARVDAPNLKIDFALIEDQKRKKKALKKSAKKMSKKGSKKTKQRKR